MDQLIEIFESGKKQKLTLDLITSKYQTVRNELTKQISFNNEYMRQLLSLVEDCKSNIIK